MKTASDTTIHDVKQAFPFLTKNEAEIVLALIQERITGGFFSSVERWVGQCHHEPSKNDKRMEALNQLLNGHGVEGITPEGEISPKATYVNMGDTYAATVVLDLEMEDFYLTSWGDWLEKWEAENQQNDKNKDE